jgi:hypothetical protein
MVKTTDECLTICSAPAAKQPTAEQHRRDERLMQRAQAIIMMRLEWFAQEFERLAETAKQGVQAEHFKEAVADIAGGGPLTAAGFSRYTNFPGWLKDHAERFEQLAATQPQKALAASFRDFTRAAGSAAVKDIFQQPLVNELVEDIKAWMEGSSNGVPFASLSPEGKRELVGIGVDWTDYINRGLAVGTKETWMGIEAIIDNAIAGKPSEQWMAGAECQAAGKSQTHAGRESQAGKTTLAELKQGGATAKPKAKARDKGIER